ncbi:Mfs1.2 [Mycena venus]|uniref:Mfs1.2 n=1 Tax=Mycena venus TaxID=2733690 RepID=A0A8H6WYE7_9AGAR|nr:Mfs1.2 [Mycena venus]
MQAAPETQVHDQGLPIDKPGGFTGKGRTKKDIWFWLILVALFIAVFLAAIELAAVPTALPVIIGDLHGSGFVWVGSAYPLASTAILPLSGGLAEVRNQRLESLVLFSYRSQDFRALCGSAENMSWLISARSWSSFIDTPSVAESVFPAVQGLGGGGILSLSSIIISDMVALRERGTYNAIIGLSWSFASVMGPLVGGAFANTGHWRWLFYMNLPIGGLAIVLIFFLVKLPVPPGSLSEKLMKVDWIGNALVIASTISMVIGLTWGGVVFPWNSPHVLVPLILGFIGLVLFFIYEARYCKNPIVPFVLLSNKSSLSGYIQTFINSVGTLIVGYYLPVYYQACKDASVIRSGVNMLGLSLSLGLVLIFAGASVTVFKMYRIQIWFGWSLFIIGAGIFSMATVDTPTSFAVGVPVLMGIGSGTLAATTYFPVLAPLPISENAHALAFFLFLPLFRGYLGNFHWRYYFTKSTLAQNRVFNS